MTAHNQTLFLVISNSVNIFNRVTVAGSRMRSMQKRKKKARENEKERTFNDADFNGS